MPLVDRGWRAPERYALSRRALRGPDCVGGVHPHPARPRRSTARQAAMFRSCDAVVHTSGFGDVLRVAPLGYFSAFVAGLYWGSSSLCCVLQNCSIVPEPQQCLLDGSPVLQTWRTPHRSCSPCWLPNYFTAKPAICGATMGMSSRK